MLYNVPSTAKNCVKMIRITSNCSMGESTLHAIPSTVRLYFFLKSPFDEFFKKELVFLKQLCKRINHKTSLIIRSAVALSKHLYNFIIYPVASCFYRGRQRSFPLFFCTFSFIWQAVFHILDDSGLPCGSKSYSYFAKCRPRFFIKIAFCTCIVFLNNRIHPHQIDSKAPVSLNTQNQKQQKNSL